MAMSVPRSAALGTTPVGLTSRFPTPMRIPLGSTKEAFSSTNRTVSRIASSLLDMDQCAGAGGELYFEERLSAGRQPGC